MNLMQKAQENLIAKAISELHYEQVLNPQNLDNEKYELVLKSNVHYEFEAWKTIWGHVRVQASTVTREGQKISSAGQFFIDAQADLGMNDITLGNFLEEMNSTLFVDVKLLEKNQDITVDDLISWNGLRLQSVLNGHPKILLNKGRLGWGAADQARYAPESEKPFQLHWISISASQVQGEVSEDLLKQSLSEEELGKMQKPGRVLIPVHPWQWDHVIQYSYQDGVEFLGPAGDSYLPQISLRTLSNVTRPGLADIKLPLSILNTSAVRGLSPESLEKSHIVSTAVEKICANDPLLQSLNTEVLKDLAGVAVKAPSFSAVKEAPYRYKETLGALWRQSSDGIITGSLFHQDAQGKSFLGALVKKSGLSMQTWLQLYFRSAVIPLYHLQRVYGLGLVAHGQNIVLKLKNFAPHGICLKDFQGDLRISSSAPEKLSSVLKSNLTVLPAHYLIHDLITGHFVTVLRFVSQVLKESDGFSEEEFYQILKTEIQNYLKDYPLESADLAQDLLRPRFERVLLNKVRFQIGYGDTSARPLPILGEDIQNPLNLGVQNG